MLGAQPGATTRHDLALLVHKATQLVVVLIARHGASCGKFINSLDEFSLVPGRVRTGVAIAAFAEGSLRRSRRTSG